MLAHSLRNIVFTALIAAAAPVFAGCYVEADAEPAAYGGYEPTYTDDGYVVYYDAGGAPYYYVSGRPVYVSPSSPYYHRYVTHYRTYGTRYNSWYRARGYRYRQYRYTAPRRRR